MRYDTIKRNAVREFVYANSNLMTPTAFLALLESIHGKPRKPQDVLKEWVDAGCKVIEEWDIRKVSKLVELFPSCVPPRMRNVRLRAEYDEAGNWAVFPS